MHGIAAKSAAPREACRYAGDTFVGGSMPLQEIQLVLSNLKTALDVGSFLIKTESALDKALLKIELEKMIDALVEAKHTVRDLDDTIYHKDKLIEELNEKLRNKAKTVNYLGARYVLGSNGEPTGQPYCPTCWATDHILIPLTTWSNSEGTHKCGKCKNTVIKRKSPLDADSYIKANREASDKEGIPFEIVLTE